MASFVSVQKLEVRSTRVVATVCVGDPACRRTTPELMQAVCVARPKLPQHACVNGVGDTFAAVMDDTDIPHLLEHLVIDFQVEAMPDSKRVLTGMSRWLDVDAGLAEIQVSYADDLIALRAFRDAAELLNSLR